MFSIVSILAEVGDKIPRLPVLVLWCAGISVLAWALGRKKRWLGLLTLPLAGFYAAVVTAEPLDRFVGPAIVRELGYSHSAVCFALAIIPFAIVVASFFERTSNQSPQPTPLKRRD